MAAIEDGPTVHFGATGYQDFTSHGDEDRKAAYLRRHESRENWTLKGVGSAVEQGLAPSLGRRRSTEIYESVCILTNVGICGCVSQQAYRCTCAYLLE